MVPGTRVNSWPKARTALLLSLPLLILSLALCLSFLPPQASASTLPAPALTAGSTWTLRGHVSEQEDMNTTRGDTMNLLEGASIWIQTSSPATVIWEEGESFRVLLNISLEDLGGLTELRLDALRCYMNFTYWDGDREVEMTVATSGVLAIGASLTEGRVIRELDITFTEGFPWDVLEEQGFFELPLWLTLYMDLNFTAYTSGGPEFYRLEGVSNWHYVRCAPPGFFERDVEVEFILNGLDTESGMANMTIITTYIIEGHELSDAWTKEVNTTAMEPWLWHLSEAWCFFYWEDFPLWDIPPLLLTEDWQATGESWLDYVARQAEELDITLSPSFTIEQEILAGRKVEMAIFGLHYPVNISRTETGYMERASGTWSVSTGYDTGTGALLTRTWTEDVDFYYYEHSGSLFIQEGSKSVSYSTEVVSTNFEFGEELQPPTLRIARVEANATEVATGETVAFDITVANEGDLNATGAVLYWSSPYFTGPNGTTFDVPAGESTTVHLELTAQSEENVTATITFSAVYEDEVHDTAEASVEIFVPVAPAGPVLSIRSASLSADEVLVGGKVELRVEVENTGDVDAEGVVVRLQAAAALSGDREATLRVPAGGTATATFILTAQEEGDFAITVIVSYKGEEVGREELSIHVAKVVEPTTTTATTIASGAVAGVAAAGISMATAGISAAAGAAPTAAAAAAPTAVSGVPTPPPAQEARPGVVSKVLSGVKYALGRRKRRRVLRPPRNSIKLTLGLIVLSAAFATGSLLLAGARLELGSIPTSIYTSAIGFTLALAGISLFVRRLSFYREFGIEIDAREKAYLALTLILGLWGAASSALGLASVVVPYLASIPLASSAVVVGAYTVLDMRSWL